MFLNEINYGIVDESKRLKYQQKFLTDQKFRNQELEYILILIDRYINYEKPQMLAKTYLSYLQNEIDWITINLTTITKTMSKMVLLHLCRKKLLVWAKPFTN